MLSPFFCYFIFEFGALNLCICFSTIETETPTILCLLLIFSPFAEWYLLTQMF
jgi:hypothetical protein